MPDPSEILNQFLKDLKDSFEEGRGMHFKVIKDFCDTYDLQEGTFGVILGGVETALKDGQGISQEEMVAIVASAGAIQYDEGSVPIDQFDRNEARQVLESLGAKLETPALDAPDFETQVINDQNQELVQKEIAIAELMHKIELKF